MRTPLVQLLKLHHALLWGAGAWTVPPVKYGAGESVDALFTDALKVREDDDE